MKQLFEMLELISSCTEWSTTEGYIEVPVKGWNLPDSFNDCLLQEFREWHDDDNLTIEVMKKKEIAYSCARYFDGQAAADDGYAFYINYHDNWKQGRGKVTIYTVKIMGCPNARK